MPDSWVFARLVAVAEFMLQAKIPEPTRQLLAATIDTHGEAMFADWLTTYDAVVAAPDDDERLIIRETTQERWVNSMRAIAHPLPQALVAIYDNANAPIAAGVPPLTEEAADAVLDIYAFQSSIVNGTDATVAPARRKAWKSHLAACYPMLGPAEQQWIGSAPLTGPMMRHAWKELSPAQQQAQRQAWAGGLPQVTAWVQSVMKGPAAQTAAPAQPRQMTPQQVRQHDQQIINALQNVSQSQHQASMAVARNMRF